jgi:hypothetical protein
VPVKIFGDSVAVMAYPRLPISLEHEEQHPEAEDDSDEALRDGPK